MSNIFANISYKNFSLKLKFFHHNNKKMDWNNLSIKELMILQFFYKESIDRYVSATFSKPVFKEEKESLCDRNILFKHFDGVIYEYTILRQSLKHLNKRRIKNKIKKYLKVEKNKRDFITLK